MYRQLKKKTIASYMRTLFAGILTHTHPHTHIHSHTHTHTKQHSNNIEMLEHFTV